MIFLIACIIIAIIVGAIFKILGASAILGLSAKNSRDAKKKQQRIDELNDDPEATKQLCTKRALELGVDKDNSLYVLWYGDEQLTWGRYVYMWLDSEKGRIVYFPTADMVGTGVVTTNPLTWNLHYVKKSNVNDVYRKPDHCVLTTKTERLFFSIDNYTELKELVTKLKQS